MDKQTLSVSYMHTHTYTHIGILFSHLKGTPAICNNTDGFCREGNGTPLQCSCLENPMDGGAWQAVVHGVTESGTQLSDFSFTFMHWRRKWQPIPVFLPGQSQGQGSLVGCLLWGHTELDRTEVTWRQQQQMDFEGIMLSEINHRGDRFHVISLICLI